MKLRKVVSYFLWPVISMSIICRCAKLLRNDANKHNMRAWHALCLQVQPFLRRTFKKRCLQHMLIVPSLWAVEQSEVKQMHFNVRIHRIA